METRRTDTVNRLVPPPRHVVSPEAPEEDDGAMDLADLRLWRQRYDAGPGACRRAGSLRTAIGAVTVTVALRGPLTGLLARRPWTRCRLGEHRVGHAEVVVLEDLDRSRVLPARRALRVASHLEGAKALIHRVVGQEAPDQRLAEVQE